jgi:uncharacterized protein (DUF362 family)
MVSAGNLMPVAITKVGGQYPRAFPFNPHQAYPEYTGKDISSEPNYVYESVRKCFRMLAYDNEHFDSKEWNPLGFLIKPGDRVFIKPNLVTHQHRAEGNRNGDIYSVITHPSVIRAVADYAAIALRGRGEIIIGDNPSIDADFEELSKITQLNELAPIYNKRGIKYRFLDLRPVRTDDLAYYGFKSRTKKLTGDPEGSSVINLGSKSYFRGMNPLLFRGIFTKRWETIKHHHGQIHEYSISNTILNSDAFISIPKLKTHHKVGATLNIKGLVGIGTNKNYLIHWRIGFPKTGGDEFPSPIKLADYLVVGLRHLLIDILPEKTYAELRNKLLGTKLDILLQDIQCLSFKHYRGAWDGNDTCWRMAADLYNVFVKDATGWRKKQNRNTKTFSVIDGVTAGEQNGPFHPAVKNAQVVIAGEDLLLVDCTAARLMDFNPRAIKYLDNLAKDEGVDLGNVKIISEDFDIDGFFNNKKKYLQFVPPSGWNNLVMKNGEQS